jgi:hypothetical protein
MMTREEHGCTRQADSWEDQLAVVVGEVGTHQQHIDALVRRLGEQQRRFDALAQQILSRKAARDRALWKLQGLRRQAGLYAHRQPLPPARRLHAAAAADQRLAAILQGWRNHDARLFAELLAALDTPLAEGRVAPP